MVNDYEQLPSRNSNAEDVENQVDEGGCNKDYREMVDLTVNTYNFPIVLKASGATTTCVVLSLIFITIPVCILQAYLLAVVVDESLLKTVVQLSPLVFWFQVGVLVIVVLSLAGDVTDLMNLASLDINWVLVRGSGFVPPFVPLLSNVPLIGKEVSLKNLLVGLQGFSLLWTAFASALFISEQKTRSDVVLGAFTLTFINTIDESIMLGIQTFGKAFLKGFAEWKDSVFKEGFLAEGSWWMGLVGRFGSWWNPEGVDGLEAEPPTTGTREAHDKKDLWKVHKQTQPGFVGYLGCSSTIYLVLVIGYFAMSRRRMPFKLEVNGCSGRADSGAHWTTIASPRTCSAAAQTLRLSNDDAHGEGLCVWHAASATLKMIPASSTLRNLEYLCQPSHAIIPTSADHAFNVGFWYWLLNKRPRYNCAVNGMEEISSKRECIDVAKTLQSDTRNTLGKWFAGSRVSFGQHDPPHSSCMIEVSTPWYISSAIFEPATLSSHWRHFKNPNFKIPTAMASFCKMPGGQKHTSHVTDNVSSIGENEL